MPGPSSESSCHPASAPRRRPSRGQSLRREIVAILAVKLVLILAIKLAFFSDAVKPGSEGAAAALLGPAPAAIPTRSAPHE